MEEHSLEEAIKAFREGRPVLVFDDWSREAEVDYVIHASAVDVDVVYEMRVLCGGLICYAMPLEYGRVLGLDLASEILRRVGLGRLVKRLSYGDEPAFSIWVNKVTVATGIRDYDRAETIRGLDEVNRLIHEGRVEEARTLFYNEFMSPGHIPILLGRSLRVRRGHTELGLALAELAGLRPSIALVEMLTRGRQLLPSEAARVARDHGYPMVTGRQIIKAFNELLSRRNSLRGEE